MDALTKPRTGPEALTESPPPRIVVGVDGFAASDAALQWAVDEAQATGADLMVCHAYRPVHIVRPVAGGGTAGTVRDPRAEACLAEAVATARRRLGHRRVTGQLRLSDPATMLVDEAAGSRMLVVGTHGYRGPAYRFLSSTATRVAADADADAVVIRPLLGSRRGPFAGHVVVGVDGTGSARAALGFGFEYAETHRLPLAAVHVADEWPGDFWTDEQTLETYFAEQPPAQTLLATEVEPFHHRYPAVAVKRAGYGGDPVRGLLRAAGGAALLVVGDRRRDRMTRMLLGSVSHGIASQAPCPVAVVHAPEPA